MKVRRSLSLAAASDILDGALSVGRSAGLNPLAVIVVDSAGVPVALKSEDGCGPMRINVALAKAYGGLGMGTSSRNMRDRMAERPQFSAGLAAVSEGRFIPAPGGVLIVDDGEVIGAVGVSGDTSEADEMCAVLAIEAAGLTSDPPSELVRGDWPTLPQEAAG